MVRELGRVGIVANPNSGKDIRRLVTHATVIDNSEKVNILRRIITGILGVDDHEIYIMSDRYRLAKRALDGLTNTPRAKERTIVWKMPVYDLQRDTILFAKQMVEDVKVDVMIVMGGDGTNRAVAKEIADVPQIAVSTGTNNVYPTMVEGTSVAFAAAAIASGILSEEEMPRHGKRIDIKVESTNGVREDIALIDAVFSSSTFVGAKALLDNTEIHSVLVTQCHPASIGFSALAGSVDMIGPEEDQGLYLDLDWDSDDYVAAISAGSLIRFGAENVKRLGIGDTIEKIAEEDGIVAVDGEREMPFRKGDKVTLTLTRNGPRKVDVPKVVEYAAKRGYFRKNK